MKSQPKIMSGSQAEAVISVFCKQDYKVKLNKDADNSV